MAEMDTRCRQRVKEVVAAKPHGVNWIPGQGSVRTKTRRTPFTTTLYTLYTTFTFPPLISFGLKTLAV